MAQNKLVVEEEEEYEYALQTRKHAAACLTHWQL